MMAAAKRFFGTAYHPEAIHRIHWQTFKANMLSDPSTYPLIVIMGGALTMMTMAGIHALKYKDAQLDWRKRESVLRYWGEKEPPHHHMTGTLVYWNSWQKLAPEGLGIDHKKWLKSKNKSME
jgi:hypothetical protein